MRQSFFPHCPSGRRVGKRQRERTNEVYPTEICPVPAQARGEGNCASRIWWRLHRFCHLYSTYSAGPW